MADRAAFVDPFESDTSAAKPGFVDPFETKPATPSWSEVPLEAVKHVPSNLYDIGAGMVGTGAAVAKTVAPYATEGVLAPPHMAFDAAKAIYQDPSLLTKLPRAVWNDLVEKYGGEENIRRTLATRPVDFALDLAAIIAPVEGAVSKVGEVGRAADVSKPFFEGLPREPPPTGGPPAGGPPPLPPGPVQAAIESQPRALTTDKWWQQQAGQVLSKIPFVGANLGRAIEAVPEKFGEARTAVADELGGYRTPQNIAGDIRSQIGGAAETETKARQAAAQRADELAQAEYERANQAREQAIAAQEQQSTQAAQRQIGDVAPVNMGDTIMDTVRASHDVARNAKDAAYRDAAAVDATVLDSAVGNAHGAVDAALRADAGQGRVDLSAAAVPTARGMMRRLRQFSNDARNRTARAIDEAGDPETAAQTGQSMRDIEGVRQDLNFAASGAENDADRRAAQRIIEGFDQWHQNAMGHSLMEGSDPSALAAFQRARAANADFRQRFGYNDRNDADAILNKIVQPGNQIGSEDISKALFAGGNKPTRLLDAIFQATGEHPNHGNVVQAVRGGFWNKLAGGVEGGKARTPEQIASGIHEFLARRDMANRLYSPEDQALARAHANTLRGAVQAREEAAALAKQNRPVPTEVTKGPMQELADRVLGKGQKEDEALFSSIEDYAKSKGGGKDIATLAEVMRNIPPELKANFRNTFIRRLGVGTKNDFSPAKFADEWSKQINPQAKMVLFGDGAHVRALNDLADASRTFDEVHRRFGNPSGSGQAINFAKVAELAGAAAVGSLIGPAKLLAGWFAGRKLANFLATPAGAASASRFTQQMRRLQSGPTIANATGARLAVRNMRNTAISLGIANNIPDPK